MTTPEQARGIAAHMMQTSPLYVAYMSLADQVEALTKERDEYKQRTQRLMTTLLETKKERDELAAAAKLALDALEWFVENDDTNIGMPGNEFWEDGLNQGIQTITALRQAGVQ